MKADRALVLAYTEAFFLAAKKAGAAEAVSEQCRTLDGLLRRDGKLRAFMEAPNIPRDTKENLFVKALGGKFHQILVNFVRLLIRRGRLEVFVPAMEEYQVFHRRDLGITPATVVTAIPLQGPDRTRMEAALGALTGKKLVVDYKVDPGVIGGVAFECEDLLIDATIAEDLDRMRHRLMAARVF